MQQQIQQQAGCDALLTKPPFTSTDRSRCCVAGAMDTLHHPLLLNSERKPVVVEEMKTMLFLACPVVGALPGERRDEPHLHLLCRF